MHITRHAPRCSKCGSINYEEFSNIRESGTRCLDCGHVGNKKSNYPYGEPEEDTVTYTYIVDKEENAF